MIYPIARNKGSNYLMTTSSYYTEEYARGHCSLYLSDELIPTGATGTSFKKVYRLHATEPHRMVDYLKYRIQCPQCHAELRPFDGPINYHDLGRYICPGCENE